MTRRSTKLVLAAAVIVGAAACSEGTPPTTAQVDPTVTTTAHEFNPPEDMVPLGFGPSQTCCVSAAPWLRGDPGDLRGFG